MASNSYERMVRCWHQAHALPIMGLQHLLPGLVGLADSILIEILPGRTFLLLLFPRCWVVQITAATVLLGLEVYAAAGFGNKDGEGGARVE
jgi:hypothetical protein